MEKKRVMFICIHNSGRSQMGEAFLRHMAADRFDIASAGIESGTLNPLVVKAMEEVGVSMEGHYSKKAQDFVDRGDRFDYVITVCDESSAERCPMFPGKHVRMHWGFPDPSALTGTDEEKLAGIRPIRDEIRKKVTEFIHSI